ncbi:hypothetical protein CTI12_AA137730 [Artemisia annua]|uniref:Dof zinc finger protein n=1 Tax=Artemisia annua TaxID=35608 RepID=A0A2U1PLQ4_ARTAN|nr:hypothetical protein CTI12_AA137730 [Artemisia annua]
MSTLSFSRHKILLLQQLQHSQPRHFCHSCRRHWTHGGVLRNIPVGGGSRKNTKRKKPMNLTTTSGYCDTTFAPRDTTTVNRPPQQLPCPRCHSQDTKFCYYNNYNIHSLVTFAIAAVDTGLMVAFSGTSLLEVAVEKTLKEKNP